LPRVIPSAAAERDADDIWFWIATDSPNAADRMLALFDEVSQTLAEFPMAGVARDDLSPGLRSFPAYPYLLFYRPVVGGVEIIRVLHGRRNITTELFNS
jgi:toxin ParE1/3/4